MGVAGGRVAIVDGLRIHYERHGDSGDAIVCVHGYLGAKEDWEHQVREFAPITGSSSSTTVDTAPRKGRRTSAHTPWNASWLTRNA